MGSRSRTEEGRGRLVLLLAGLVLVALNLRGVITIVGPLADEIRADTGMSRTAAGLLTTAPLLAFGVVSPLAAPLARRFGSDRTLVAAMLAMTAALVLRALPTTALLLLGTVVAGCGIAIGNVLMPALIKRHFPERAAFMVATYSVVMGIGAAIAAGLAVPSAEWLGGWRAAIGIWAVPALLGALLWLPQVRAAPRRTAPVAPQRVPVRLWGDRIAWQVAGFLAVLALQFYALAAWLPDVYRAEGLSAASAGGVVSVALIAGLPLGLVVGVAAYRLDDQRSMVIATTVPMLAGWLGVLLAPMAAPLLWAALLGCAFGFGFPLTLTLTVLRAPDVRHAAELSGMSQAVGYTVAAVAPVALGALHDASGSWTLPLVVLTAATLPALLCGIAAGRPGFVRGGAERLTAGRGRGCRGRSRRRR